MRSQRSAVVLRTRAPASQSIDIATDGRTLWLQADDHLWYAVTCVKDGADYILSPAQVSSIPGASGAGKASWLSSDGNTYTLGLVNVAGRIEFGQIAKSNTPSRFKSTRLAALDGTVKNLTIVSDQGNLTYQLA